ncbi:MAG: BON domain-containing protein [Gammaproteobacteria bacterium]|nr:BON domain-containing protein [Gammaproteobacteria bacterium]MBI5616773.1 BON domain-containing protein [Gammaproteobacteria bacterium]
MNKFIAKTGGLLALCAALAAPAPAADTHTAGQILDDTVVTTKVKAALIADPITKAHQVTVNTYKGAVKLSGFVDTAEAKRRAVEVARNVEGAATVEDDLEVRK